MSSSRDSTPSVRIARMDLSAARVMVGTPPRGRFITGGVTAAEPPDRHQGLQVHTGVGQAGGQVCRSWRQLSEANALPQLSRHTIVAVGPAIGSTITATARGPATSA